MRKFATLAATALCAGTALAGASAAHAGVSVGANGPDTAADPTQVLNSVGFANNFCGAPWLWAGQQQAGSGCDAAQHHNLPEQQ